MPLGQFFELLGGHAHGRPIWLQQAVPSLELARPLPLTALTAEPLTSVADRLTETDRYLPTRDASGRRVYLHADDYALVIRYEHLQSRAGDVGETARQLMRTLVARGLPRELRAREIAAWERLLRRRLLEERLGGPPDLRALHEARVLAGNVWTCGDPYCNCSQAQVITWDEALARELGFPLARPQLEVVWRGPFHTDGEPGAGDELALMREYLELVSPTLFLSHIRDWEP